MNLLTFLAPFGNPLVKWFGIGSLIAIAHKDPSGAVSPYSKLEC